MTFDSKAVQAKIAGFKAALSKPGVTAEQRASILAQNDMVLNEIVDYLAHQIVAHRNKTAKIELAQDDTEGDCQVEIEIVSFEDEIDFDLAGSF